MADIIVALDDLTAEKALALAEKLSGTGVLFKANDLLDDPGPNIIEELSVFGGVMADPKFHDIPNTVGNRVKKMANYGPRFITVHASGRIPMMRAAVEKCGDSRILAVTVLTSLGEDECQLTFGAPVKAKVLQFARDAVLAGVHGIVCSPKELEFLSGFPELAGLIKVTPGIRPVWHLGTEDQARVTTPADAVKMGANYLVIGRPIVKAEDPAEAVRKTQEEISVAGGNAV
ncbi:MAG: orotidine-5'-phosphate decarboxylase [Patescibacteria group bacterium]|nr:orotidine-5'-phosphate decarboxylase [Patescibacteria group bacterium]MDD5294720.1 orotidine-5'-phosphate decarboxylase [Patescibacteria group bacterium]MDD5554425.1 orotidine-5'-phosphate decarboxylase [Patescibacteria group bacterium]